MPLQAADIREEFDMVEFQVSIKDVQLIKITCTEILQW